MDTAPGKTYDVGGVLRARPFNTGRLGHLGLYVEDIEACEQFYAGLLGFHVTDRLDLPPVRGTFLTYNADHHAMVLIDADTGRRRGPRYESGVTVNQISFQVSSLREVVAAHELLLAQGMPVWRIGRDVPGSNWAVYFTDPDGHTVELFYGMEQIGWDRRSKPSQFQRFRTAEQPILPQQAELDEVRAVSAEDVDLATGFQWDDPGRPAYDVGGVRLPRPFRVVNSGPVSLFVSDVERSVGFYRDGMGMGVTEEVDVLGHRVVFLRTGIEHHTITLLPMSLREQLGLPPRTTLMSYGIQVGDYRQLRDARDFLLQAGCQVVDLPREVHTGIDYALHVLDPEGHCVQLYHEMEMVGSSGRPLAREERRTVTDPWPRTLDTVCPTSPNQTFQGPLG